MRTENADSAGNVESLEGVVALLKLALATAEHAQRLAEKAKALLADESRHVDDHPTDEDIDAVYGSKGLFARAGMRRDASLRYAQDAVDSLEDMRKMRD